LRVEIIHLDPAILILNKPAGLAVLPEGWDPEAGYLLKLLQGEYGRIWVVHRLDKVTSGVMVFARTAQAHRQLNRQFERHEAVKSYHALVGGVPAWDERVARHPLRTNVGHRHRTIVDARSGKAAETRFRVLQRYAARTLLQAQPVTGRTHQVRAHAAALGFPLLGDETYGAAVTDVIARPALHAHTLTIRVPLNGDWSDPGQDWVARSFTALAPDDFESAVQRSANGS
jgi:RluA family pseudouridine synthase